MQARTSCGAKPNVTENTPMGKSRTSSCRSKTTVPEVERRYFYSIYILLLCLYFPYSLVFHLFFFCELIFF